MGQERKEKPEEGRPTCRHARTKVWFREKRSSNVQTQTFITPPGSSGSEASALCSNDTGVYQCSSSKWHDRPSDTELARCHQVDSTVEQSGSVEDDTRSCRNPKQFANLRKKCESRGSSSSRASSHQEKRIYLHLNLRNRESPQLLVCPKRNHCQHHLTSRSETVIQVDSEPLPRPSRPPSRFSEPALSMFSFARRSGHQNLPQISLHDSSQLQSLRQTYAGSGSRSSSDKLPSPTASLTPKRRAHIHNVERQLAHERAMSITPRGCDLDSHSDLAQLAHERAMSTTLRGSDLDPRFNHALRRHNFSSSACGACDPNPQSQISASVEEEMLVARHGYVDEALLPLPKWPHGQPLYAIPKSPPSLVKNEVMLEPDSVTLGRIATPRIISSKKDPMRVKGGSGTLPTDLSNWYVEPVESSAPPKTDGVVLSWEGLTVTSKVGKMLLDNLNGQIICGFTAIIGPSGSGKSTLLNTLACRMGQSASITGRILLNGRDYKIADLKKMSGYVMQDDLLNAHLTVEETLKYTTRLKLEPSLTEEEVYTRVDDIIKQMGLDHVRNTVIGSPEKRGISGGERKRVCVGMELLTHPQLLFLDEPTSGLDSVTALSLCEQLQKLAAAGNCTIICTIHQPQAKIFNLFHYLIILKAGQVIYQGKASEVLQFFEDSGFPCPEYTNPADHLLDVITPSMNKPRESLRNVDDALRSKFNPLPVNMSQGSEYLVLQTTRDRMPWHRQYMVILNRGFREQIRKKNVFITQMCQSVLMALLIGGVFFQIGDHQKSTVRRQPVLFFCVINQGVFGALTVINSFPGERALTLRERAAGMYYCSSYFMAKVTAEMVSQVISPVIFSCIVYWMVGFQRNGSKFMIFMVLMVLCQLAATSLALMVSAICRTTDLSVTVLPMALEVNRLFGGFFLSPKSLPKYFVWLDALSYVKYTYTAISLNELHGLKIRCTASEYVGGECPITSGEQTIRSLGLDYLNIGSCTTILLFYILITRVIAYLGIRYLKK